VDKVIASRTSDLVLEGGPAAKATVSFHLDRQGSRATTALAFACTALIAATAPLRDTCTVAFACTALVAVMAAVRGTVTGRGVGSEPSASMPAFYRHEGRRGRWDWFCREADGCNWRGREG
jgi:hypothetical protein